MKAIYWIAAIFLILLGFVQILVSFNTFHSMMLEKDNNPLMQKEQIHVLTSFSIVFFVCGVLEAGGGFMLILEKHGK